MALGSSATENPAMNVSKCKKLIRAQKSLFLGEMEVVTRDASRSEACDINNATCDRNGLARSHLQPPTELDDDEAAYSGDQ